MAEMLKLVPFVGELEGAIRVAWDPEKAPGPHRRLLVSLCQALGPYLRGYPVILALFDEIPEFASEFSKAVLGCGATSSQGPQPFADCQFCEGIIPTKKADLREKEVIYHPIGNLAALNSSLGAWSCCISCYKNAEHSTVKHDHCQICENIEVGGVTDPQIP